MYASYCAASFSCAKISCSDLYCTPKITRHTYSYLPTLRLLPPSKSFVPSCASSSLAAAAAHPVYLWESRSPSRHWSVIVIEPKLLLLPYFTSLRTALTSRRGARPSYRRYSTSFKDKCTDQEITGCPFDSGDCILSPGIARRVGDLSIHCLKNSESVVAMGQVLIGQTGAGCFRKAYKFPPPTLIDKNRKNKA